MAFLDKYAPDPADTTEPEDDELDAGLEELQERFGVLLTADALAAAFRVTRKQVLDDYDAATCYTQLRVEQAKSAYQRRYAKIQHAKRK